MKIIFRTRIRRPLGEVKAGFDRALFEYLAPPGVPFKLLRFDGCKKDDEVHIELNTLGVKQLWVSVMTLESQDASSWFFLDEGKILPWPLSRWKHEHRVDRIGDMDSEIVDDISFSTSPAFMAPVIYPILWLIFSLRPKRYKNFFEV
jgi:ligand-binding SRPBCC domain-containing protein